jgi:hypothetical protein
VAGNLPSPLPCALANNLLSDPSLHFMAGPPPFLPSVRPRVGATHSQTRRFRQKVLLHPRGESGLHWFGGLSPVVVGFLFLHGGVSHSRGSASPRCGRVFFLFVVIYGVGFVDLLSQKGKKKQKKQKNG